MLGLHTAYLCTNFDHYSYGHSRDMVDAYQNLNGSCDLTTPISGMICCRMARTCYGQPAYQIWSLYHYERMKRDTKCGNGVVWGS